MTAPSLFKILPHAPENTRIAVWTKNFAIWRSNQRVQYTWEPILFKTARSQGSKSVPSVRDFISCNITLKKGLPGAKPAAFNDYILELLGWQEGDEVDDLFPGTNGLQEALERRMSR
jgi:hypothetical protein